MSNTANQSGDEQISVDVYHQIAPTHDAFLPRPHDAQIQEHHDPLPQEEIVDSAPLLTLVDPSTLEKVASDEGIDMNKAPHVQRLMSLVSGREQQILQAA